MTEISLVCSPVNSECKIVNFKADEDPHKALTEAYSKHADLMIQAVNVTKKRMELLTEMYKS